MEISRREFLRLLGMSTAGASLGTLACDSIWSIPDDMYERIAGAPRIETWKSSVCSLCSGGCGIKVRLIDGIPVRIQGNPLHPLNRGGICPMAEAGVEALFNPDRVREPLKRIGERGENKWESVSWEEALQMVVSRLRDLRARHEAHKLAFFVGNQNSLLTDLIERFMQAFGSPNLFNFDEHGYSTLATLITQGHKIPFGYNFEDLDLLVNFGADLLDVGPSPVRFNQLYSELRNRENGRRARIIHIDSRLSRTASNSNEWVSVVPGTMGALALGMVNVLIKDGQYNKPFVKTNSFGFENWRGESGESHKGFRSLVVQEYYPEKVSKIAGVPAAKIVELAREFGAAKSALVLAGGQAVQSSNGLYTLWAIECLNALKGNFTKESPISFAAQPPFQALPQLEMDEIASRGLSMPQLAQADGRFCFSHHTASYLPNRMMDKQPYPIEVLFLDQVNPLFKSVNQERFLSALNEIPLIVSFASFVDDTTHHADLILPDHTFLERQDVVYNIPMVSFAHFGFQQPAIEPLYNTRHIADVLLPMATDLGGTVAKSMSWPDYQRYLQFRLEGIYKTGAGTIFTERMDEAWLKFLKERGWQIFEYTTFDEFRKVLSEKGGWWDPFPQQTDFRKHFETPSKRFEFYSQVMEKEIRAQLANGPIDGEIDAVLERWKIAARGDEVFLPHYEPARFDQNDAGFPIHLLPYDLITNINGAGANLPLLQELFGLLVREYWRSWIEINPETAHTYGIGEGDIVKVTSPRGSLEVRAKLLPSIMPDVVHIPFGLGHKAYGRYAKNIGVNPHEILSEDYDFCGGILSKISTKVELKKVTVREQA